MYKDLIKCPVCEMPVFDPNDFPGSYCICPKCGWEDDNLQHDDPDYCGGANDVSLNQAKQNFKNYGTANPSKNKI